MRLLLIIGILAVGLLAAVGWGRICEANGLGTVVSGIGGIAVGLVTLVVLGVIGAPWLARR